MDILTSFMGSEKKYKKKRTFELVYLSKTPSGYNVLVDLKPKDEDLLYKNGNSPGSAAKKFIKIACVKGLKKYLYKDEKMSGKNCEDMYLHVREVDSLRIPINNRIFKYKGTFYKDKRIVEIDGKDVSFRGYSEILAVKK